ncbi:MAG: dicarboxylate/amino acid:cation symporter [Oscillospiraceae bacterium]|nr:dicarboxylate/amino acid:cation symporter [Oscillospiraceae bacterium]
MFRKISLTAGIALALVLGVLTGLILGEGAVPFVRPLGQIYLNLIKTIVIPVVTLSIILGVVSLQDVKKVGSLGLRTLAYFLCTTAIAVTLGLTLANLLGVGGGVAPAEQTEVQVQAPDFAQTIINIFPANIIAPFAEGNMLPVIVIAIFVGFGILLAGERGSRLVPPLEALSEVFLQIMGLIIRISPVGVFALILPVVAQQGIGVLLPLLGLIAVCYLAYGIHVVLVYGVSVAWLGKIRIRQFFREMGKPILFGFSSASSVGALPFNMEATRRLGVSEEVSGFVLPLGTTVNMDGTAIYQGVCAIFIARVFGTELTLVQQLSVVLTSVLASVGTAGAPGSGMIMLAMVLESAGLPVEGIALVAGIDRILDMGRTAVNITGDAACSIVVQAAVRKRQ